MVLAVAFGDAISRRFLTYVSWPHRIATALVVGLMLSTWLTYLSSLAFRAAEQPLVLGDAVVSAVMLLAVLPDLLAVLRRFGHAKTSVVFVSRPVGGVSWRPQLWDSVLIVVLGAFVTWMMSSTFNSSDGLLRMGAHEWGDLGPTTAIAQSFALGHNFPTEYPLFTGQPIKYHFLYQF